MQTLRSLVLLLLVAFVYAVPAQGQTGVRSGDEYTVRPGDVLRIRVWPDASMNGEYPVETSGMVNLPLVGELKVADMTLPALRQTLTENYGRAMKSPVISVIPVFNVAVMGAVNSPGVFPVLPTETLMDVVTRAGGFARYAKSAEIRVIRAGGRVEMFNGRDALSGSVAGLALQSGDRIVVPEGSHLSLSTVAFTLQFIGTVIVLVNQFRK